MLFYGNFTKYHLGYAKDDIFTFGIMMRVECSYNENGDEILITADRIGSYDFVYVFGLVYCSPEASYRIGNNKWFSWSNLSSNGFLSNKGKCPPPLLTSFDNVSTDSRFAVPNYRGLYIDSFSRCKNKCGSTLSNLSVLMPLVVYGMREPKVLKNWSAIGETKLVNMIDMSHIHSGELFIDTSIELDYHRYIAFPAMLDFYKEKHSFLGIAVEIDAKEDEFKNQSNDFLNILLKDTYRNFDRLAIKYDDDYEVEWAYDELDNLFNSSGVFNLTKNQEHRCMVYGLGNTDGSSTEFKFNCLEGCKINSIIGYRE